MAFVLLYNTSKTGMKYDFLPLIFEFVLIEFYRIYRRLFWVIFNFKITKSSIFYKIYRISRIQFLVKFILKITKYILFYTFYRFCRFCRIQLSKTWLTFTQLPWYWKKLKYTTPWIQGKVANLESMVSGDCASLLEHVILMGRSCFDTNFAAQIKLTKFLLIHCFDFF